MTFGLLGDREAVVDPAHRQDADRAARAVNQLDVRRQHVLQAEAIDGVGVAAADLHDAIVPAGVGEAINLFGSFGDQFWISEFVYISHR